MYKILASNFHISRGFVLFPLKQNTSETELNDKIDDFIFLLKFSALGNSAVLRYCATLLGDECRTSWYSVMFSKRRLKITHLKRRNVPEEHSSE
jgi:hypothetical protein